MRAAFGFARLLVCTALERELGFLGLSTQAFNMACLFTFNCAQGFILGASRELENSWCSGARNREIAGKSGVCRRCDGRFIRGRADTGYEENRTRWYSCSDERPNPHQRRTNARAHPRSRARTRCCTRASPRPRSTSSSRRPASPRAGSSIISATRTISRKRCSSAISSATKSSSTICSRAPMR